MEFWGVEVKAGEPLKCEPGEDRYVHLSQASLAEFKKEKASEPVRLYVKVGDQKLVLGTLSSENCTQISFDLVFEKDFELSHNWKNGSVHFCGYKTLIQEEDTPDDYSDSDEEEVPMLVKENGKPQLKEEPPKPASQKANVAKPEPAAKKVKVVEPKQEEDEDESNDDDEDDDESDDLDMLDAGDEDDEDSEEESSDEEDEATPKKAEQGKKRPSEPASKTSVSEKKTKLTTPTGQKTGPDGKKGGHTATPYPSKQGAKTSTANDKSKQMTPKSGGQFSCKPCNKTFNSENALSSHTKAKHSAGK